MGKERDYRCTACCEENATSCMVHPETRAPSQTTAFPKSSLPPSHISLLCVLFMVSRVDMIVNETAMQARRLLALGEVLEIKFR